MEEENNELHEKARYTMLNEHQKEKIGAFREVFSDLYRGIEECCTAGREIDLVLIKLEEAQMWLNKAISREK